MKKVILEVRSPEESMGNFVHTWKSGKAQRSARIGFATPELLWKVLSAKRWELLKALCGAGSVSIREASRRVKRDVKAVHRFLGQCYSLYQCYKEEPGEAIAASS